MPDHLSISNLLSLLEADHNNSAIKLCLKAEALRRRRRHEEAITVAQEAVSLVKNDVRLLGVTLLYSSAACLAIGLPQQERRSVEDCDRAIVMLRLVPFNYAVAQVMRARIELQRNDVYGRQDVRFYFDQAEKVLQKTIENLQRTKDLRRIEALNVLIKGVAAHLRRSSELPPSSSHKIGSKSTASSKRNESTPSPFEIVVPTRLIWPPNPATPGITPLFVPDGSSPDSIDASYVLIDGQLYLPYPINVELRKSPYSLPRPDRIYFVLPITGHPRNFVLIRKQDRPDLTGQMIVIADHTRQELWIAKAVFPPPYDHFYTNGSDRVWTISPEFHVIGGYGEIIGVVEATLSPLPVPADLRSGKLQEAPLAGVDLSEADLTGVDLRKADLSNTNLKGAILDSACLKEAILQGANLLGANLHKAILDDAKCENADFSESDLSEAVMYRAVLDKATLNRANLSHSGMQEIKLREAKLQSTNLRGADLEQADLTDADLTGARLDRAKLLRAKLHGAQLMGAHFHQTDLRDVDIDSATALDAQVQRIWYVVNHRPDPLPGEPVSMVDAILRGVNLEKGILMRPDFTRADLADANFSGARLLGASFEEANLESADLRGAQLQGAMLNGAYLGGAKLSDANLSHADLTSAYLHEADLRGAKLHNADLSRSNLLNSKIDPGQLTQAKSLSGAILPDGTIHA